MRIPFRTRILRFVHVIVLICLVGAAMLGAIIAAASLLAGESNLALNATMLPINLLPYGILVVWLKRKATDLTKIQNITAGFWIVPASTIAGYAARFLPDQITLAAMSITGMISVALWLIVFQVTRRMYRAGRQRNLARFTGRPLEDPEVIRLANNSDLATATVAATLATVSSIVTMNKLIAPVVMESAVLLIGMNIGAILGFMYFNFCHNQSDIRELISSTHIKE